MEEMGFTINDLVKLRVFGCRSTIYELIKAKKLRARKRGRSTIILAPDAEECLQNLPDFHEQEAA